MVLAMRVGAAATKPLAFARRAAVRSSTAASSAPPRAPTHQRADPPELFLHFANGIWVLARLDALAQGRDPGAHLLELRVRAIRAAVAEVILGGVVVGQNSPSNREKPVDLRSGTKKNHFMSASVRVRHKP